MKLALRFLPVVLVSFGAASLAAQQTDRAVVFQAFGGGASHLRNLNSSGDVADFKLGYNLGGAIGIQLSNALAFHGDFTYIRNEARGAASFAGTKFDRFFYGGHLELSYPTTTGLTPFLFGGGGAVTVHQAGRAASLTDFTKPAAMFGAGFRYLIPKRPVEFIVEGKSLIYKWDAGGFARTQWDLSYSAGLAYRLGF